MHQNLNLSRIYPEELHIVTQIPESVGADFIVTEQSPSTSVAQHNNITCGINPAFWSYITLLSFMKLDKLDILYIAHCF